MDNLRNCLSILLGVVLLAACQSAEFAESRSSEQGLPRPLPSQDTVTIINNPILPGFHPDPAIVRAGADYYIATSSFEWFPGVPLYHSRDLVHWRPIGHALTRKSQADLRGIPASAGIYAPSLHYHDGRFYLVYTVVQTDEQGWPLLATPNYLIHTDDIYGAWSEPVYLNSVGFDPSLFFDDDGKVYLLSMVMDFRRGEPTMGKIALQRIEPETGAPVGEMSIILDVDNLWGTEGPHLYKKDGYYYLLVAQGGTFYEHAASLARSEKLEGPYVLAPNTPFLTSQNDSTLHWQRAGHGALVETPSGEWYLAHLASRALMPDRKSPLGREACLQKVTWTASGWLRLAHGSVAPADSVLAPRLPAYPFAPLPARDEFDRAALRLDYQYLREPPDTSWLKLREGTLQLRGRRPPTSRYDLSLVARRITSYQTAATTSLAFSPTSYRHKAGLAAYYDNRHFYWLAVTHDDSLGRCVELLGYENGRYQEWGKAKLKNSAGEKVALRFEVAGSDLRFSFREAGEDWQPIGGVHYFGNLADEQAGRSGFTGSMAALLSVDLLYENTWSAFDYFSLEP